MIQDLILKRFRSIQAERVTFDNPTFLVGQNASGKSNFVDAYAFLSEAMASPLQQVLDRRGGIFAVQYRGLEGGPPSCLGLGVVLSAPDDAVMSARYGFELQAVGNYGLAVVREQCVVNRRGGGREWFDRRGMDFTSSVGALLPAIQANALALPLVGGDARFSSVLGFLSGMRVYAIDPARVRERQSPKAGERLRWDGANAAAVLGDLAMQGRDDVQRICQLLEAIVPRIKAIGLVAGPNGSELSFTEDWGQAQQVRFTAADMSDGTLRALGLLTAVFQKPPPSVLVVEEPEATIHPGALGAILDLLRHASRHMQVIVTTHSPDVLEAEWLRAENLRIVTWQDGATRILPLGTGTCEALREHLMSAGGLLRSNALRPLPVTPESPPETSLFEELPA
jgi:predicted ATPase